MKKILALVLVLMLLMTLASGPGLAAAVPNEELDVVTVRAYVPDHEKLRKQHMQRTGWALQAKHMQACHGARGGALQVMMSVMHTAVGSCTALCEVMVRCITGKSSCEAICLSRRTLWAPKPSSGSAPTMNLMRSNGNSATYDATAVTTQVAARDAARTSRSPLSALRMASMAWPFDDWDGSQMMAMDMAAA